MGRYNRKIKRDYQRPFFSRRRSTWRWVMLGMLIMLILMIPVVAFSQYDRLQLAALDAMGFAPTPTPFAAERADMGEQYYRSGDIEQAMTMFGMAVQQQPDNINYLYEYGRMLIEMDRNQEAAEYGAQIIEIAPNDPRGYALQASAIAWTNPTEAIPIAQLGVEIDDQFAPLRSALAIAYTQVSRYQEALRQGDLAVRLDPYDADARRSYAYPLIFTGDYAGAIAQLEQAIAINPNLPGPYFELASLYRNVVINQPEMAVAIYNEVLRLQPDNARAHLRLCETYAASGLFREAEPYCNDALAIDPLYASAHRMRGQLRYSRRNYEGSIESFETCISLGQGPNGYNDVEIECLYIRGLAHYFLAQCEQAWEWLNISLQHPEAEGVMDAILTGLENVTIRCPGYQGRALPTPIPPTPIPPTPIGGY